MRTEDDIEEDVIAEHPRFERGEVHGQREPDVSPDVHIALHTAIEVQLENGDPPKTGEVLDKLLARGMDRHDAIHAIATALVEEMATVAKKRKPYNPKRYSRALDRALRESR